MFSQSLKSVIQIYRVGDKTIDVARREICAGDAVLRLRKKAFNVLVYLLANRYRTVTKQELLASSWEGTSVSDDVLVGCVAEIRKVLGDNPAEPALVKTIHGVGYHFIGEVQELGGQQEGAPVNPRRGRKRTWKVLVLIAAVPLLLILSLARWWRHQLPHDEVAWWKFEENTTAVTDSAGGGNGGRIYGG